LTTFEDIARQKLSLAVDNTDHRQMPFTERMSVLVGLIAAVAFIYVVWPLISVVLG